jgi:hypothetical protein
MATTPEQTGLALPPPATFLPTAEPPPAIEADADEAPRGGVYAPELPRKILPLAFPSTPVVLERKPITPNFNFLPGHGDDE